MKKKVLTKAGLTAAVLLLLTGGNPQTGPCQPLPGGTLDPLTVPKYVTPLVIPPVMPASPPGSAYNMPAASQADYNIAVRQFRQQILPAGLPATTVWSYGRAEDELPRDFTAPVPVAQGISFNYPAFTMEATVSTDTKVRWINDLVDGRGNYLPHLLPVDQTLHWANPPMKCKDGTTRTDCMGFIPSDYKGPVPLVPHVHGAHVRPESDGYPEAWWLPAARNIPGSYATQGSFFDQHDNANTYPGSALYSYPNDQRSTTLWYHDHALGMTRLNVYAGPAGFWLLREAGNGETGLTGGTLPGPAPAPGEDPNFDAAVRGKIREIPIVIQDRSFNEDGSLFYPAHRAFFEGLEPSQLRFPFIPSERSDISRTWTPEAFFNVMVVNGVSWPFLEVEPERYRFRLLNGCSSRFLNLAVFKVNGDGSLSPEELPLYVIGTEGGLLPEVVKVETGQYTVYNGAPGGTAVSAPDPQQALLLGLAERADVVVDFSGFAPGTRFRMINTGPDAPFGGFPDTPADPATTGQVMEFVVGADNGATVDNSTAPADLLLAARDELTVDNSREVSLNEEESNHLCVTEMADGSLRLLGSIKPIAGESFEQFAARCETAGGFPFAPKAALLGTVEQSGPDAPAGIPLQWTDMTGESAPVTVTLNNGTAKVVPVTENPVLGQVESWKIYNFTMDAHPIHLHLVQFQVVGREGIDGGPSISGLQPYENGWKDTVIAYPGEITEIKARFDIAGLFVWHCHILEHEDNEMMRPYVVSPPAEE